MFPGGHDSARQCFPCDTACTAYIVQWGAVLDLFCFCVTVVGRGHDEPHMFDICSCFFLSLFFFSTLYKLLEHFGRCIGKSVLFSLLLEYLV